MEDKTKSSVYLIATIITALATITAAVLSNDKIADAILEAFRKTDTITIAATPLHTGVSIYAAGDYLLNFSEVSRMAGIGDTETDNITKFFITFHLRDIPSSAELISAEIRIPCDVEGTPELLGPLILREYTFGTYDQTNFNGVPESNWGVRWQNTAGVVAICKSEGILTLFSQNDLTELVQQKLESDWIQFVLYIDSDLIIPNQSIDAIVLTGLPVLILEYY